MSEITRYHIEHVSNVPLSLIYIYTGLDLVQIVCILTNLLETNFY